VAAASSDITEEVAWAAGAEDAKSGNMLKKRADPALFFIASG
jgi:hypothetical protein